MTAIKVPPLGESIVEAVVSRWLKKEGDAVASGDTLVELETDKITVEVPAMAGGVLTKRLHAEGETVHVNDVLAEIEERSATGTATETAKEPAAETPVKTAVETQAKTAVETPAAEVRASPAAKRVAADRGVDLATVSGTGRGGVVSKPDVIEHEEGRGARGEGRESPPQGDSRPPMSAQPSIH